MSSPIASGPQNTTEGNITATYSQAPASVRKSSSPTWVDGLLFWLDWSIKVLGVAAALVFGIWAPLSYQATNNARVSGDAAQSSAMSVASSQAAEVLAVQSSAVVVQNSAMQYHIWAADMQSVAAIHQSKALDEMNSRIGAIGQLSLLEFCLVYTVREVVLKNYAIAIELTI
jgi:hypothetical protein